MENILHIIGLVVLIQLVFFIVASFFKTDKVTDLSYGLTFVLVVSLLYLHNGGKVFLTLFLIISLWGLRISGYLFYRIFVMGKDKRFNGIRENNIKFARFWLLQAVSIIIILTPILFLQQNDANNINVISSIGVLIWLIGFIVESVADYQKFLFRKKNSKDFIKTGLWKYSQHPNYFGEILCWAGVFVFCVPNLDPKHYWAVISPVYVYVILRYITGIPPLRKLMDKKFTKRSDYAEYKKLTSKLLLLPTKKK